MLKPILRFTITDIQYDLDVYLINSGIKCVFKTYSIEHNDDEERIVIDSTEFIDILDNLESFFGVPESVIH